MNSLLIKHFERDYQSNRLSHAFLVCNTYYEEIKDDLEYVLSNYFFDVNKDLNDNPDLYIIKPTNDKILKDEIIKLQESFMTYSLTNKNKVYIIEEVEKMNQHASNSLLKFLEEPAQNIYAILITSNLNKVLPTIKSRCQILMIDNKNDFNMVSYDKDYINKILDIISGFEKDGYDFLPYIYTNFNKKIEKEDLKSFIKVVKYFYEECLNNILNNEIVNFKDYRDYVIKVSKLNDVKKIVNKLYIIVKEENKLDYNLNTNLFLDNLLIRLEGKYYE